MSLLFVKLHFVDPRKISVLLGKIEPISHQETFLYLYADIIERYLHLSAFRLIYESANPHRFRFKTLQALQIGPPP